MKIKKTCRYIDPIHYNVLPAVLITKMDDGIIIALKWFNGHIGVYITT